MTSRILPKTLLEVERKFAGFKNHHSKLYSGSPPFKSLCRTGSRLFRDIYYDTDSRLSKAGTWVRKRDGMWESKIRQAGDYNTSQFKEIQDHDLIRAQVAAITGISQPASLAFGLKKMADITTKRESWLADDRFKIVLDETDFEHTVGEVELEVSVDENDSRDHKEICAALDEEISTFMRKYSWAFNTNNPTGKLTAYFADQKALAARASSRAAAIVGDRNWQVQSRWAGIPRSASFEYRFPIRNTTFPPAHR